LSQALELILGNSISYRDLSLLPFGLGDRDRSQQVTKFCINLLSSRAAQYCAHYEKYSFTGKSNEGPEDCDKGLRKNKRGKKKTITLHVAWA